MLQTEGMPQHLEKVHTIVSKVARLPTSQHTHALTAPPPPPARALAALTPAALRHHGFAWACATCQPVQTCTGRMQGLFLATGFRVPPSEDYTLQ